MWVCPGPLPYKIGYASEQRAEARAELSVELAQARILPAYELGR